MPKKKHLVLAGNDAVYPYVLATLLSAVRSGLPESVEFHLITDRQSIARRGATLHAAALRTGLVTTRGLKIHHVDDGFASEFPLSCHLTPGAYYRLQIPRLLGQDPGTVIYLDCDILVRSSLTPLFCTSLGDSLLAAVAGGSTGGVALSLAPEWGYFNSGVMVLDLDRWRSERVADRALCYIAQNADRIRWADQDALNAVVAGRWLRLDKEWNWQWIHVADGGRSEPRVVHFSSSLKPWHWNSRHPYTSEYRAVLREVGWPGGGVTRPTWRQRLSFIYSGLRVRGAR